MTVTLRGSLRGLPACSPARCRYSPAPAVHAAARAWRSSAIGGWGPACKRPALLAAPAAARRRGRATAMAPAAQINVLVADIGEVWAARGAVRAADGAAGAPPGFCRDRRPPPPPLHPLACRRHQLPLPGVAAGQALPPRAHGGGAGASFVWGAAGGGGLSRPAAAAGCCTGNKHQQHPTKPNSFPSPVLPHQGLPPLPGRPGRAAEAGGGQVGALRPAAASRQRQQRRRGGGGAGRHVAQQRKTAVAHGLEGC